MKIIAIGDGKMGKILIEEAKKQNIEVLGVVGFCDSKSLASPYLVQQKADCVIDFSHKSLLPIVASYCQSTQTPAVIGTTNLSEADIETIFKLSKSVAVCQSDNFSFGIAVFKKLFCLALKELEKFDLELIEMHHNKKGDSPSGTAKALMSDAKKFKPNANFVFGREGEGYRKQEEIGVFSLRGGSECGTHTAMFFGQNENLNLTHSAQSKEIFVLGAIKAAKAIINKKAGLYNFGDLI